MAFRFVARRSAFARPSVGVASRGFHSTPRAFVKVGQEIPDLPVLVENTPANKINLADEFRSKNGIIIGVPAAFSGVCSSSHVPSYLNHPKLKDAGSVFVVSVNDPFVYVRGCILLDSVSFRCMLNKKLTLAPLQYEGLGRAVGPRPADRCTYLSPPSLTCCGHAR